MDQRKDVLEQLIAEKFDVIVYEQYTWLPLVLAELLNISSRIFISSCPLSEHQTMLTGVPLEFSYVPAVFGPYTDEMSVTERFFNIFRGLSFASTIYYDWNYRVKKDLEDRYGKDFPMPWEIAKKADLVAINTDEFIDYPRPLPPNVIHIGGLGMDHHFTQALTSPYKEIMERGRKGVVLFSLGSIVETNKLPKAYMKNVFEAIKKFEDYCFMVKINNKDGYSKKLAKKIKNVYLVDWAPQPPILGKSKHFETMHCNLAHPRLHLFVTHGGYNSILEAAYSGVPILGIGMLWDQPRNVKVVERNGWGLTLDKLSLKYTSIEFEQKMRCLLTVVKYKESALRIQRILKTKPQTGEQRLLSYIRFLEQNGGHLPELKSIAPHLSVIVYHNIDVIFYVVVATTVTVGTLAFIIKKLISLFLSFSWTKKQKIA